MCLRYSSSVVAPMQCNSPRANIGFRRLPASIEPSPLPAPTTVCNSSINKNDPASRFDDFLENRLEPFFKFAAILGPGNEGTHVKRNDSLVLQPFRYVAAMMRWARPSAMAVLPTPGSPMRTGLFFVRRDRTWTTRRISSSRPMTGSSLPDRAKSVRSMPYFSSD